MYLIFHRAEKERWIQAKYVQHSFVHPHTSVPDIQTTTNSSPPVSTEQLTQQFIVNKPLISHSEDALADDSAPESEYDTKSLKRKKKQNKIRRWAMDKLVKRAKESVATSKETPSATSEGDDISITSRDVPPVRTYSLRERKSTLSVGEMPPPKPPRTKKIKSAVLETSVMEPLLSTEDPIAEGWYKSGSLFEKEDFCDSIMEVIKNIGYTCDSPSNNMMNNDNEVPTDNVVQSTHSESKQGEEEVIANGNVLECDGSVNKTLAPLTVETQDLTDGNQPGIHVDEEIPDEFQRYNGDDQLSTTESLHEEAATSETTATRTIREKSVSASDISLEFYSAHSSPIGTLDSCGSPIAENPELITTITSKPAKKLETTAWTSDDSSSGATSGISLQESPPSSKASTTNVTSNVSSTDTNIVASTTNVSANISTSDANVGTQTSVNVPSSIAIEISEAGGVNKDGEPCSTPGESDTGPSYVTIKNNMDTDVSSSTLVPANNANEENPEVKSSNPEVTSSLPEVTSSTAEMTSITDATSLKVSSGTASPVASVLAPPETGDPFTSDDELEDSGRPSSTPEPIIIPLSKSAHEVGSYFLNNDISAS